MYLQVQTSDHFSHLRKTIVEVDAKKLSVSSVLHMQWIGLHTTNV